MFNFDAVMIGEYSNTPDRPVGESHDQNNSLCVDGCLHLDHLGNVSHAIAHREHSLRRKTR
jgi:hypothetical protein